MKSKTVFFLLVLLCALSNIKLNAQETYLKNRWNIKLSAAPYPSRIYENSKNGGLKAKNTTDIRLEGNYGILNFLEIGIYVGYARYKHSFHVVYEPDSNGRITGSPKDGNFLSYGIQTNVHIFPFFIKKHDFRFDLYITAKYGGRSALISKDGGALISKDFKYEHEWAAGLGFAFYFSKHIGIFAEYSFGKFFLKEHDVTMKTVSFFPNKSTVRAGFSVKFKPEKKQK